MDKINVVCEIMQLTPEKIMQEHYLAHGSTINKGFANILRNRMAEKLLGGSKLGDKKVRKLEEKFGLSIESAYALNYAMKGVHNGPALVFLQNEEFLMVNRE